MGGIADFRLAIADWRLLIEKLEKIVARCKNFRRQ
jgi:hypothetical protein